jgi:hypothetical protein
MIFLDCYEIVIKRLERNGAIKIRECENQYSINMALAGAASASSISMGKQIN